MKKEDCKDGMKVIKASGTVGTIEKTGLYGAWVQFDDDIITEFKLYSELEEIRETEITPDSFHPSLAEVNEGIDEILKERNSLKFRLTIHGCDHLLTHKEIKNIKLMLEAIV